MKSISRSSPSGPWLAALAVVGFCLSVLAGGLVGTSASSVSPAEGGATRGSAGPNPAMHRWTIDGGGGMFSTGGNFELSGTIGQHDAGTVVGGDYELNGGFWFPLTTSDCNTDGTVDLYDYESFVDCVTGPDSGPVASTCGCTDHDHDGDVDLRDWGLLQTEFGR